MFQAKRLFRSLTFWVFVAQFVSLFFAILIAYLGVAVWKSERALSAGIIAASAQSMAIAVHVGGRIGWWLWKKYSGNAN